MIKQPTPKINISGLDLYYGDFHALKNINLPIMSNEITAFIGPSGCGKSTTGRAILRLTEPTLSLIHI